MLSKIRQIHFVGIGGIGMSGIAEVLLTLGYRISGSDLKRSSITQRLSRKGAKIRYRHSATHIEGSQVVVISSAVRPDNPEWQAALKAGIPVILRAEMLAELMRVKHGVAIAGSHGKTTTTSLVAWILHKAGLDPTLVIGGRVKSFRSNAKLGKGEFLVAEADESDGSFMRLTPTLALITNIDPEHLDHYQNFETLKQAFIDFGNKVPFYGSVIFCEEHPVLKEIQPHLKRRVITYGFSAAADFYARNIETQQLQTHFDVYQKDGRCLGHVRLKLAGRHNVLNALGSLALVSELSIPFAKVALALETFRGIERRMEVVFKSKKCMIVDDYGHHPEEIKATLAALKNAFPNRRLLTLFQPHRFTRTRDLFHEFLKAFDDTDLLFLTEVYAAGEDPIAGCSGNNLAAAFHSLNPNKPVSFCLNFEGLISAVKALLQPEDIVLTLGAGDIFKVGRKLSKDPIVK